MRLRPAFLIPAAVGLALLTGCSAPTSPATTGTPPATGAGATAVATPTAVAARPIPSPSVTAYVDPAVVAQVPRLTDSDGSRRGCVSPTSTIPPGAATTRIPDVDGDGRIDTEFLTTTAPFLYGIRTAAGGVSTFTDPLPSHGVHSAWITATDSTFGSVAVLDDGHTAVLLTYDDCALAPIRTTDGADFELPLTRTADRSTGVTCTNQNGGILIAAQEARRRADGNYDLYEAVMQSAAATNPDARPGEAGLDDIAPPARYTDLPATDPRITQASGSYCWTAPRRVQIGFD